MPRTARMRPVRCAMLVELLAEPRAVLGDVREQRGIGQPLEHVVRDRRDERTAAERRAVVARLDRRARSRRVIRTAPIGKPAGDRLGQRQHVGLDAELLVGEQRSGATEPALDLVEDQQRRRARCVSARTSRTKPASSTRTPPSPCTGSRISAATVSGFERDGEIVDVALDDRDARRERTERRAVRRAGRSRRAWRTDGRGMPRAARRSRASRRPARAPSAART